MADLIQDGESAVSIRSKINNVVARLVKDGLGNIVGLSSSDGVPKLIGIAEKIHTTTVTTDGNWDQGTVTLASSASYLTSDVGSVLGGSTAWAVIGPACSFDGVTPSSWLPSPGINLCVVTRFGSTVATFVNGLVVNARALSAPAVTYIVNGSSTGPVSLQSSPFTITTQGTLAAPVTINISATGGALSASSVVLVVGTNSTATFTFTPNATPQTCVISFTNTGGLTNPASRNWVSVSGTTAPGAPTGLTLGATTATTQALTWLAPASNGGSVITDYRIGYRAPAGSGVYTYVSTGSTTAGYTVTGLTAATNYDFVVDAVNVVGNGTDSALVNTTTTAAGPTDVLTFGRLSAVTTAATVGGYQVLSAASATGQSGFATTASLPNRQLQADPASPVYFDFTIGATLTGQVGFGLHTDKTTDVTINSCAYAFYLGYGNATSYGTITINAIAAEKAIAANDTYRFLRTAVGGGNDTFQVLRARSGSNTFFPLCNPIIIASDLPLYPRVMSQSVFADIVVKCNGDVA